MNTPNIPKRKSPVPRWAVIVATAAFLISALSATWFGPNSHSMVALVISGFVWTVVMIRH